MTGHIFYFEKIYFLLHATISIVHCTFLKALRLLMLLLLCNLKKALTTFLEERGEKLKTLLACLIY